MVIAILSTLCIFLLVALVWFLHKVWWTPKRIQHEMRSQGIKGPPYRFLYGNTKEIIRMREESLRSPMEYSSHHISPRIKPHIHAWKQLYGIVFLVLPLKILCFQKYVCPPLFQYVGKNYLIWHGPQAQLVVTEPELIKEILNNKDGAYRMPNLDLFFKKLFGDGVSFAEGEKWVKLRKIANQAFYAESVKGMIPAMIASVETMLERWSQHVGNEIEIYEEFRVLTSEVISRTAFGSSYLEGENIFQMLMKSVSLCARNGFNIRFPGIGKIFKSSDDIEFDNTKQAIRDSVMVMINKREERVMSGEEDGYGSDFLGSLIKASHDPEEKNRISIESMVDQCKNFYLAGQETTNGLLAWILFLLALHIDWQEKARNEVVELFGQQNPNPEGLSKLKTMTMIWNEALRLYGPVVITYRRVEKEVKLGSFIIPANTEVLLPLQALHHDPEIWGEDVHLFKPERFAEGVAKPTNNIITGFIPFGFGPRVCVGSHFATNEVKIALSMILQRYKFTLSANYVHAPIHMFTLRPRNGIQVVFNKL